MLDWIIAYSDGSEFTSATGPPEAAPRVGALAIGKSDPEVGRIIVPGQNYYFHWNTPNGASGLTGWWGGDTFGLFDYLVHNPGGSIVLFGREVANANYWGAIERLTNDPRLQPKSAIHPLERRLRTV